YTKIGNSGEYHFVYGGLTPAGQAKINLFKTVDGKQPTADDVFEFGVERYNGSGFETVQVYDKDSKLVDLVVNNELGNISIPVTELSEGQNIFRITELGKTASNDNEYEDNDQVFYAAFDVVVVKEGEVEIKLPGAVKFYTSFEGGKLSNEILATDAIFENETKKEEASVKITIIKKDSLNESNLAGAEFSIATDEDMENVVTTIGPTGQDGTATSTKSLKVGTYYIKETTAPTGYALDESVYRITVKEGTSGIVIEVDNNQTTVTVSENKVIFLNEVKGSLIITKTIEGAVTEEEADGQLQFVVEAVDANNNKTTIGTYTLSDFDHEENTMVWTKTLEKLDAGHYIVTETITDIAGKALVSVTNSVDNNGSVAAVDVANTENTDVTFTDKYVNKGKIVITKTISGAVTKEEAEGALEFTVNDGTKDTVYKLSDFNYDEKNSSDISKLWTLELPALEEGNYTITETVKSIDGKVLVSVTNKVNGKDGGKETANVTVENGNVYNVDYNDVYMDKGKLVITKTIKGDVTEEEAEGALKFTVNDGTKTTEYGLSQFAHTEGTKVWTLELPKLDAGEYTITEIVTDIDGKVLTSVTSKIDGQTGESAKEITASVENGKTTTVNYKNVYVNKGKIVITKTISGAVTKEEAEGALEFTVNDGTKDT
ncbi:MAG: hypothetical protein IKM72_05660, partial [Oscillospiraceae bacterium]|nr:hypothetical protein [Oscillospiraceae bacterium]